MTIEQTLLTVVKVPKQGIEVWKVRGFSGRVDYEQGKLLYTVPELEQFDSVEDGQRAVAVWLHEAGHTHQRWASNERDAYGRNPIPREVEAWQFAIAFAKQLHLRWTAPMHQRLVEGLEDYLALQPTESNHLRVESVISLSAIEVATSAQ
jgi:hypothetical protein